MDLTETESGRALGAIRHPLAARWLPVEFGIGLFGRR
jgi:hypothetical protein